MNNSIQNLAENILLIASPKTWVEGNAIQQLHATAKLSGMKKIVGLPDLHAGRGYPIGAAFFTQGKVYPALIGSDIGCGMALWQTQLKCSGLNLDKLEKRIGNLDNPLSKTEILQNFPKIQPLADGNFAGGTIGLGNHFAELLCLDKLYDSEVGEQMGLSKKQLQLLIHSGSRGIGGEILRSHIEQFGHHGLEEGSEALILYYRRHQFALEYAKQNRRLIALRILQNLKTEAVELADIPHNFVEQTEIDGQLGWLHRKGAAPSDQGLVVIPGSRGSYSYLVQPLDGDMALRSLAHGAGRKWKRSECKARLADRFHKTQLNRTALGSRVVCKDSELIYQEAPQAYKDIESVMASLEQAGLVKVIARFKPILTYKLGGE